LQERIIVTEKIEKIIACSKGVETFVDQIIKKLLIPLAMPLNRNRDLKAEN